MYQGASHGFSFLLTLIACDCKGKWLLDGWGISNYGDNGGDYGNYGVGMVIMVVMVIIETYAT
jgi:hypothetical protein